MSVELCKCKYCDWCDSNETKGYKWYCERYGTYEDPDEYRECGSYREK